jgi:hypothetical protein
VRLHACSRAAAQRCALDVPEVCELEDERVEGPALEFVDVIE